MQAVTLVMPRQQARKAYLEYRRTVTIDRHDVDARRRAEDVALVRAYREISRGNPVIDLPATMAAAGLGADYYPKLAIMRADQTHCRVTMATNGSAVFARGDGSYDGRPPSSTRFQVPEGAFSTFSHHWQANVWVTSGRPQTWSVHATAIVPTVPAALRPKASLERFCIMWEAVWKREAPRDPMLLKPIGWPFFAVVAVWDLTELERAVLCGRIGG